MPDADDPRNPFAVDVAVSVRLVGLEGIAARIQWVQEGAMGIKFERPLYQPIVEYLAGPAPLMSVERRGDSFVRTSAMGSLADGLLLGFQVTHRIARHGGGGQSSGAPVIGTYWRDYALGVSINSSKKVAISIAWLETPALA